MSFTLKEKVKTVITLLGEPKVFYTLISFRSFGYLFQSGWFNTFKSGESVDADFKPIPWFTYSAIDFLIERMNENLRILEFGSGNSTLFFAERTKMVFSIEHDESWYQKILLKKPQNVKMYKTSSLSINDYILPLGEKTEFDLIIVDGLFRNQCINNSLNFLSESGVIVLDDSERTDYTEGIKFLKTNGFKQLNFFGIAPGIFFRKSTTIFYKERNCLGI
jgi:hypothetical protein